MKTAEKNRDARTEFLKRLHREGLSGGLDEDEKEALWRLLCHMQCSPGWLIQRLRTWDDEMLAIATWVSTLDTQIRTLQAAASSVREDIRRLAHAAGVPPVAMLPAKRKKKTKNQDSNEYEKRDQQ